VAKNGLQSPLQNRGSSLAACVNTGANRFIVNDQSLFTTFKPCSGVVKGIGGNPLPLTGVGTVKLNLKSDTITIQDAVYLPTSPFNLLPPQLLLRQLKELQYKCNLATH
jgi:hypothetical protein